MCWKRAAIVEKQSKVQPGEIKVPRESDSKI